MAISRENDLLPPTLSFIDVMGDMEGRLGWINSKSIPSALTVSSSKSLCETGDGRVSVGFRGVLLLSVFKEDEVELDDLKENDDDRAEMGPPPPPPRLVSEFIWGIGTGLLKDTGDEVMLGFDLTSDDDDDDGGVPDDEI